MFNPYGNVFAGEKVVSSFGPDKLRESQDWTGNGWVSVRGRPDLVTSVLSSLKTKQNPCKSYDSKSTVVSPGDGLPSKKADTCSNSKRDKPRNSDVVPDLSKDDMLSQLRWKSSRKRRHRSGTSFQKPRRNQSNRKKSPKVPESDDSDSIVIQASLKVDHDDCKCTGDPSIFSSSVVPSLTNLVMCR